MIFLPNNLNLNLICLKEIPEEEGDEDMEVVWRMNWRMANDIQGDASIKEVCQVKIKYILIADLSKH